MATSQRVDGVAASRGSLDDVWPRRVLMVCSSGGHLAQLLRLEPWYRHREVTWVTFDKPDSRSLLAGEDTVWAHHPTTRNVVNLARNLALAHRTIRRARPDLVVSSGAAVALPFFLLARRDGVRTTFVEVYDRFDTSTMTGRLCRPFTDRFCVQWDEQQALYRDTHVIGRLL